MFPQAIFYRKHIWVSSFSSFSSFYRCYSLFLHVLLLQYIYSICIYKAFRVTIFTKKIGEVFSSFFVVICCHLLLYITTKKLGADIFIFRLSLLLQPLK